MSYDLLEVPEGYKTSTVLLVAPYFDPKFIKTLVKKLSPEKIRLVIDDGVRSADIKLLIKAAYGTADIKVALGAAAGLVHIKGYYAEFVKTGGRSRRKRRFFYGSANATDAAFHGRRNAELIASVDLSAGEDGKLLEYLAQLIMAVESGSGRITGSQFGPLRNSPILHLPSFRITPPGPAPGFDAWLQRGLLAAKYREAQQFLTVSVKLQQRLPRDIVSTVFANRGLEEPGARNVVRFRYMRHVEGVDADDHAEDDDTEHEGAAAPQWKARYCTWTHFGDWLSDDCYRAHGADMVLKNGDSRRAKIEELLKYGTKKDWLQERKAVFLDALSDVWIELEKEGRPSDYLTGDSHGINRLHYDKHFERKLLTDYQLAQDRDFCARYVNGYEFPGMPKFRQDRASWDGFVRSWCESVALEAGKKAPRSFLAKRVVAAVEKADIDRVLDPEEIGDWLRKSWGTDVLMEGNKTTVGQYVMAYHVDA